MATDLNHIMVETKKALVNFNINFRYTVKDNVFYYSSDPFSITGVDDKIFVTGIATSNGMACMRVIFETIEPTAANLKLVNEFNRNDLYFKCFINEQSHFEMCSVAPFNNDDYVPTFIVSGLLRLLKLAGPKEIDPALKEILKITNDNR